MIVDALSLDSFQRCPRAFHLHHSWKVRRVRPKSLLDRCLRAAIRSLEAAADPTAVATSAKADFMRVAAEPGLDIPSDANPYQIAKDHCAMLATIIAAIAKSPLPVTKMCHDERLAAGVNWRFQSRVDDAGTLHRWITVDTWTADDLARELHAWRTIGDIAGAAAPLTLHVIVIGRQRNGRRASPWARAFRHPTMPNRHLHFATKTGKPLKGWTPVYLADDLTADVDDWVERMAVEGVMERVIQTVSVKMPEAAVLADTKAQIIAEAGAMADLIDGGTSWPEIPMSRAACDGSFTAAPCPFQWICYGGDERVDISALGLYDARDARRSDAADNVKVMVR